MEQNGTETKIEGWRFGGEARKYSNVKNLYEIEKNSNTNKKQHTLRLELSWIVWPCRCVSVYMSM